MRPLTEGDPAPDFELPADGGGRVSLARLRGRKVVLYVYPKDDTSGCTREAIEFSQLMPAFAEAGVEVVGMSPDSPASHDKFKAKHGLEFALASDPDKTALDAYGVWTEKSMYGRKYMGVERSTFLIGPDGRIARIWRNVKVPGHAQDVLEAVKTI
jgi:peroxiredoxin Q/BCP